MRKITIVLLLCSMTLSAQKVERTKGELGRRSSQSSSSGGSESKGSSGRDEEGGLFFDLFINIVGGVFKYGLIGDYGNEEHLYNRVTVYPYADRKSGNYADSLGGSQFRIDVEDQFLYNSNTMFGNHMKSKIRPFQYFYLQADYRELFERRIDNTGDRLALMHLNLCYDRVRLERFNLGWNLGVSYVGTEVRKAGFCYGLSAEYFAGKNISFSASAKWSKISMQPVNTYEFYGRFHRRQFFAALGFEHLKLATPTYNFVSVGGGLYL